MNKIILSYHQPSNEYNLDMRQNKEPTVLFTKKYEEPELYFHCKYHPGCRMVRMATGLRCQICGGNEVAVKTVDTVENKA